MRVISTESLPLDHHVCCDCHRETSPGIRDPSSGACGMLIIWITKDDLPSEPDARRFCLTESV